MKKISGISLVFLSLLVSCNKPIMKDYDDYKEYELPSLELFYSLNMDYYFIYLTNDECKDCEEIKQEVLSYYDNNDNPRMFFFNMKSRGTIEGDKNRNMFQDHNEYSYIYNINVMMENKPNTLKETYFCCTPSIYVVKNNRLSEFYYIKEDVLNYIRK